MKNTRILQDIQKQATKENLPIIGPQKGSVLTAAVRKYLPHRILEVGTNVGYSSILMASSYPDNIDFTPSVITLEIDPAIVRRARQNITAAGLDGIITVKNGDALDLIPALKGEFNLLFLDALKGDYLSYLKKAQPKLSKKALVIADNVKMFAADMKDYLTYIRNSGNYQSRTHDFGFDAVEESLKIS